MNIQTLTFTHEILSLVAQLDEFKGAWRASQYAPQKRMLNLQKLAAIESIGAGIRFDGINVSDHSIKTFLTDPEIRAFTTTEEQSAAGYAATLAKVYRQWQNIPLSIYYIKQLHRQLLQFSGTGAPHRGNYKTAANVIQQFTFGDNAKGISIATASAEETPVLMDELIAWTNFALAKNLLHPLLVITIFNARILAVQPFESANGRLANILTNLLLLKTGYTYLPYCAMEPVAEENSDAFFFNLRKTLSNLDGLFDGVRGTLESSTIEGTNNSGKTASTNTMDWNPWFTYFLRVLCQHKTRLENKIKHAQVITEELPKLSTQIMSIVREHGRVTVSDAVKATKTSRNTIKDHIKSLVKNGLIKQCGAGRGTWYASA